MSADPKSQTSVSTARAAAFSDGVFAIAITLLVFGIKVPSVSGPDVGRQLRDQLVNLWPGYLSFAMSFMIVGIFWIAHHYMFQLIRRSNRHLLWLNILFLMCVSFIPFPASLVGLYGNQPITIEIYSATLIVTGLALYALWAYASAKNRLLEEHTPARVVAVIGRRILRGCFFYGVAFVLAWVYLPAGRLLLFLIPFFYIIPSPVDSHLDFRHPSPNSNPL
jgi:uncharacterized membrane protein